MTPNRPDEGTVQAPRSAAAADARSFESTALERLLADWCWELDDQLRFRQIQVTNASRGSERSDLLGQPCWTFDFEALVPGGWTELRALLQRGEPFRDVVLRRTLPDGGRRYLSASGVPVHDPAGRFLGYRGLCRDISAQKQREEDLSRFRAAIDASPDQIYLSDPESLTFLYVNDAACRLSGFTREEHLKIRSMDLLQISEEDLRRSNQAVIAAGNQDVVQELRTRDRNGRRLMMEVRRRAVELNGKTTIVSVSRDLSARIRAQQAVRRLSRMLAALSSTNEAILHVKTPRELFQRVCDAAVHGGEFPTAAVLLPRDGSHWFDIAAATGAMDEHLRTTHTSWNADIPEGRGLAGSAFRNRAPSIVNDFSTDPRVAPWRQIAEAAGIRCGAAMPLLKGDRAVGVLLLYSGEKHTFDDEVLALLRRMADNIVFALDRFELEAERRHAEERVHYLATHDALTGLPNRMMFSEMLHLAIESARRYQRQFAVLFIDLDRFKVINDTLGHEAGDILLKEMAARLRAALRSSDLIARFGGDEFVVLLQEISESHQVATVAEKILDAAARPVPVLGHDCRVSASVGISMFPADADDEQSLMKNADIAMYLAKDQGKNTYQFYSDDVRARSFERLAIETELRRALERNELSLVYQARHDPAGGAVVGVEVKLCWNNERLGAVTADRFLPVAEETGLIVAIGRWMLRTACCQNVAWQRQGLGPLRLAVKLSPRQLNDPELPADLSEALRESGMAPELLELGITEAMVMKRPERATNMLTDIKRLGIRLAIDDFGTGYSSLSQLRHLPVDTLKVARSFVEDLPANGDGRAITEAILALGRSMSLSIVAEGVETEAQRACLRERACEAMQGRYFSAALTAGELAELLQRQMSTVSQ